MLSGSKINVLHICGGGVRSGIETYILNLAKAFKDSHINNVICPLRNGIFTKELVEHGLTWKDISKRFRGDPRVFFKIASIIQKERIHIVHTHGENGNIYGRMTGKFMGRKLVTTVHSHLEEALLDMSKSSLVRSMVYRQDLILSAFCDKIVASSNKIAAELKKDGVNSEKITVIHSGIDVMAFADWSGSFSEQDRHILRNRLGIKRGEFLVGTMGRIAPVKNHGLLVEAAEILLKRGLRMKFIIIGDGPLFEQTKDLIARNGLNPFFVLPGWQIDVKPYLGILDAFVMTSITEGLNISVIKAMAMGIPVISTFVGSMPEILIDSYNGFLTPLGSPGFLANKILDLYSDQDLRDGIKKRAFIYAKDLFDISRCKKRYEDLYEKLVYE